MEEEDINFRWLDYKIDSNRSELLKKINDLKKEVKDLQNSIDKLKETKNIIDEIKIDIMELEN